MYPVKMLGYGLRFVGLEVANKVPFQGTVGHDPDLLQPLDDLILAEIDLAGSCGIMDGRNGLPLADGQQFHASRVAARISSGFHQQISDFSQVFRDSNHVLLRVLRYTRLRSVPGYGKSGHS